MTSRSDDRICSIASEIVRELRAQGSPERAAKERAYLKSELHHLGTAVPTIRKRVRVAMRHHQVTDGGEVVALAATLWSQPVHERRMAAVAVLRAGCPQLRPEDMGLLERMLREARTWAIVDELSQKVVGPLVEAHPDLHEVIDRWAVDDDFWLRRAVLLSFHEGLRRAGVSSEDFSRFAGYADRMLDETEFFIRKAIGWMLRDTAKTRPDLVVGWLLLRADRASGLTVREAIKPLSSAQQERIRHAVGVRQTAKGTSSDEPLPS